MKKEHRKYMRLGKTVRCNGKEYRLLEDVPEEGSRVKAVRYDNKRRYELLRAWSRNQVGLKEGEKEEMEGYEESLEIDSLEPADKIRFIDPNYNDLFILPDFGKVRIGDREYTAVYIDSCHLYLIGESGYPLCYHICQLAEWRERNGLSCGPVKEGGNKNEDIYA